MKFKIKIFYFFIVVIVSNCTSVDDVNTLRELVASKDVIEGLEIKQSINDKESTYQDLLESTREYTPFLTKIKKVNEFRFEAHYQPHLLLTLNNNDSISLEDKINYNVLNHVKDYANIHYIQFSLENLKFKSELLRFDLKSAQQYSDRIMYYSFYCNRDAYVIENGCDTLRGSFVHFERTFDVTPKLNLTFAFERKTHTPVTSLNFVFDDVIFDNGRLNFEFNYQVISVLNAIEIKKLLL